MQHTAITGKKYSLSTSIKMKLFDNFQHIILNPSLFDLKQCFQEDNFSFKLNNKGFGGYIDIPVNKEYFVDYYKNIGTPYIFGLYEVDKVNDRDIMIGMVSLILRYDNKVWQIMDLKIKKEYRGKKCVDCLISSTLSTRITKSTAYYAISMNPNPCIDAVCNNMKLPKMKNRGKMNIYITSFEDIKKILPTLENFYCSEIGFVNTNEERIFVDGSKKTNLKLLHLHHNANYRVFDYREPQRGFQYCFAIHEDNDFIIQTLKNNYSIEPNANATIFSNNFKNDWSKFVKTFEI
jgi:hypothetical protein